MSDYLDKATIEDCIKYSAVGKEIVIHNGHIVAIEKVDRLADQIDHKNNNSSAL